MTPEDQELIEEARRTHGLIAHNAALADSMLFEIFHHYAGGDRAITRATYFTLDAITGRVALTKRVAVAAKADEETQDLLLDLSEAIKDTVKHRNGIAHTFLVSYRDRIGFDHHVRIVYPKRTAPGWTRLTEALLRDAEDASSKHLDAVLAAFEALCQKLRIPPQVTL